MPRKTKTNNHRQTSSPKIDLVDQVMDQILTNKVKMKPKIYFLAGSILMALGLSVFFLLAVFFFSHFFFHLSLVGLDDVWRFRNFNHVILEVVPWWSLPLAAIFVGLGAWMIHLYDISYKKNFKFIVLALVLAAIIFGWLLNFLGLNRVLLRQRGVRRLYHYKQMGKDFVVGEVKKVDISHQVILVETNQGIVSVRYDHNTQIPHRQIKEAQLVRVFGQFKDKNKRTIQAEAIGLGPKRSGSFSSGNH